jgi:hypothetical protein
MWRFRSDRTKRGSHTDPRAETVTERREAYRYGFSPTKGRNGIYIDPERLWGITLAWKLQRAVSWKAVSGIERKDIWCRPKRGINSSKFLEKEIAYLVSSSLVSAGKRK